MSRGLVSPSSVLGGEVGGGMDVPTLAPAGPVGSPLALGESSRGERRIDTRERDVGALYSTTVGTAGLVNDAAATLDFGSVMNPLRLRGLGRHRIVQACGLYNGAGSGPFVLSAWTANGQDLGQTLVVGKGIIVPVEALLPQHWDGTFTVLATNRSGNNATLYLTLWIGPAGPPPRPGKLA